MGIEALVALNIVLSCEPLRGVLQEPESTLDYPNALRLEEMDAVALMDLVRRATERLNLLVSDKTPEKLQITSSYRIFLPERDNLELRIRPLPKAIFLLFLKHPEGIYFSNLPSYRDELLQIYLKLTNRLDLETVKASIELVLSQDSNSFFSQKTKLSNALSSYFDKSEISHYLIGGPDGKAKSIPLDPSFVIWEQ